MNCHRCKHENRPGAKFCEECAAPMVRACANCGFQLSPTANFCSECAHPTGYASSPASTKSRYSEPETYAPKHLAERILVSIGTLEGERKQVTALFADLKGSMELLADRDPEEARKLIDPVIKIMMDAIHHYEGTVNLVMGDGIMALFGAPLAHEDHAVRACYAALRMQESMKRYALELRRSEGIPIQIRVGLNSGEVVVSSIGSDLKMDYNAIGQTTHLAGRMEQMAVPGSILITSNTLTLAEGFIQVSPLGPLAVKGIEEPVEVFEVTGAGTPRSRIEAAAISDPPNLKAAEGAYQEAMTLATGLDMRPLLAHCHVGLGTLSRLAGKPEHAMENFAIATAMWREMDTRFWLEKAEAEMKGLA